MLGFTGTFEGGRSACSRPAWAARARRSSYEELIQLGATRLIRVGTCGALQPGMRMADLVVAVASTPSDQTAMTYTGGEPHAPTADWRVVQAAVDIARQREMPVHVGPIVSSDVFYDPDRDRCGAGPSAGHLGVEMEASRAVHDRRAAQGVDRVPPDRQRHDRTPRRSSASATRS